MTVNTIPTDPKDAWLSFKPCVCSERHVGECKAALEKLVPLFQQYCQNRGPALGYYSLTFYQWLEFAELYARDLVLRTQRDFLRALSMEHLEGQPELIETLRRRFHTGENAQRPVAATPCHHNQAWMHRGANEIVRVATEQYNQGYDQGVADSNREKEQLEKQIAELRAGQPSPSAPGVTSDPNVMSGASVIAGTRIPARMMACRFASGASVEYLAKDHGIAPSQVEEAIRWELAERQKEINATAASPSPPAPSAEPPLFEKGQRVRVDHPRFHGFGVVEFDTGVPRKRYIGVKLENDNIWQYEVETVRLADSAASPPAGVFAKVEFIKGIGYVVRLRTGETIRAADLKAHPDICETAETLNRAALAAQCGQRDFESSAVCTRQAGHDPSLPCTDAPAGAGQE